MGPSEGRIAQYTLTGLIAHGGMSSVYRAHDDRLNRDVALKLLSPALYDDADFRTRFEREWQTAAALRHPNILPIFDAGEWNGQLYIAMLLVEGPDLGTLIQQTGPLPLARVVSIVNQISSALDAAHATGIIHRDIKPANILVVQGQSSGGLDHVYLADFGLTRRASAETRMTRTGVFLGTVAYIAPELLQGRAADARTDEYSLGCVAYEMLTGRPPFPHDTEVAMITAHLLEPVAPASQFRPGLPAGVDSVLATALAKAPEQRFASCGAFANALSAAIQGVSAPALVMPPPPPSPASLQPTAIQSYPTRAVEGWRQAPGPTEPPPPTNRQRRSPLVPVVAVAVVIVAVIGAGFAFGVFSGPPPKGTVGPSTVAQVSPGISGQVAHPSQQTAISSSAALSPFQTVVPPSAQLPSGLPSSGQPVTGTVNLTGRVAIVPPGTLVASGATITSALHNSERPREFYAVQLDAGQVLSFAVSVDCCPNLDFGIATPLALTATNPNDISWSNFQGDPTSDGGTWTAIDPGIYTIAVEDNESSTSPPVPYTASFSITGQSSGAPPQGQPVTGTVNLTGQVASLPPGTLVVPGAEITSALHNDERSRDIYAIQLDAGQVLTFIVGVDCCPNLAIGIATPSALTASNPNDIDWSNFDGDPTSDGGTWTAIDPGIYAIAVEDEEGSSSPPVTYTASFSVR